VSRPETLSAEHVQRIIQGVLDAANELMTEFISKKRAAHWDIVNQGLYAAEQLNHELSERLRAVGVTPEPTRSKR